MGAQTTDVCLSFVQALDAQWQGILEHTAQHPVAEALLVPWDSLLLAHSLEPPQAINKTFEILSIR
jgi:hypothetical protein